MSKAESQWDGEFQFNTKFLSDGLRDFGHALKASGSYAGDSFIRISKLDEATLEKLRPFFEDIEEHLELAYNFMELKEGNEYPNGDEYLEQVALALEDAITGSDNSVFILEY